MTMIRLNSQGLSRKQERLVKCIVADDGHLLVGQDIESAEPSIMAHFSQDTNYLYATRDGIGKDPYWNGNLLMCDDVYIMFASSYPHGHKPIKDLWNKDKDYFISQWHKDKEVITKGPLKSTRVPAKGSALGFGYGLGAKKNIIDTYEKFGIILSEADSKAMHDSFWKKTFPGLGDLKRKKTNLAKKQKYLYDPFGFRLNPLPFKALNYFIQSTVNGLIKLFWYFMKQQAPWIKFVSLIHDELLYSIPINKLEETRNASDKSLTLLNQHLDWSVPIRFGFNSGENFYDIK